MRYFLVALMVGSLSAQSLRDWLTNVAMRQLEARRETVAAIQTREQAEKRAAWTRETLLRLIGGLPAERTPLRSRRTGSVDRGSYRIENLVFESQPNFFVTANLYVPQTGAGPFPAVLQPTGHSLAAKSRAFYQTLALGLVKSGFVVLTYDPLGQGERRIFFDQDLGDSKVGGTTVEHQMVGVQSLLGGESIARPMVWDAIRGIDLLEARPEVDPERIGVAGCSGGGTLTAYVAVLDPRVKAAASACYITTWEEQLLETGPQDAEQQFPDQLSLGLTHADMITAFAPKPYLVASTDADFFPIAGARAAVAEAHRIYELYDAGVKLQHVVGPGGHGMPAVVREGIYGWMNRWLKGGPTGSLPEPKFETEMEDALYVTKTGQVSTSLGGETASTLNRKRLSVVRPERLDIRRSVERLTRFVRPPGPPNVTIAGTEEREGYRLRRINWAASEGRMTGGQFALPAKASGTAILLVADEGAAGVFKAGADGDRLVRDGHPVLALDLAGYGPGAGKWASYAEGWFGPDKIAWLAMMTGKPLVGLGVEEILLGVEVMEKEGHLRPVGVGVGSSGVALLHAAAVDERISGLVLQGLPTSYREIASSAIHRLVMPIIVPDVLRHYDLPDLASVVLPRPIVLANARTAAGPRALLPDVRRAWPPQVTVTIRREDAPLSLP